MVTKEQIIEALAAQPTLASELIPTFTATDAFKAVIENKSKLLYDEKIGDEVRNIYGKGDADILDILGDKPTIVDGAKQKTYELQKQLYTELKELRGQKDSLNKDAKVLELTGEIERLKTEGGGKHVQEVFDAAKLVWADKETSLTQQLATAQTAQVDFQKSTAIKGALQRITFNPDTSEPIKKMVLENVEQQLLASSQVQDGKLVFLDAANKPIVNTSDFTPQSAFDVISSLDAIKAISLKDNRQPGGNAKPEINGSIIINNVEGKDVKKLNLTPGSFTTKAELLDAAESALIKAGITMENPEWDKLKNEAYVEHKGIELP